jgi:uroporphyrinogen-III synthase
MTSVTPETERILAVGKKAAAAFAEASFQAAYAKAVLDGLKFATLSKVSTWPLGEELAGLSVLSHEIGVQTELAARGATCDAQNFVCALCINNDPTVPDPEVRGAGPFSASRMEN